MQWSLCIVLLLPAFAVCTCPAKQAPVAVVQTVSHISSDVSTHRLHGGDSHDDDSVVGFNWKFLGGPVVPTIVKPDKGVTRADGFTEDGTYRFQLEVTDKHGLKNTAVATVIRGGNGGGGNGGGNGFGNVQPFEHPERAAMTEEDLKKATGDPDAHAGRCKGKTGPVFTFHNTWYEPCVFPFTEQGATYHGCVVGHGKDEPFCMTEKYHHGFCNCGPGCNDEFDHPELADVTEEDLKKAVGDPAAHEGRCRGKTGPVFTGLNGPRYLPCIFPFKDDNDVEHYGCVMPERLLYSTCKDRRNNCKRREAMCAVDHVEKFGICNCGPC